jgi:hypothetical protein
MMSMKAVVVLLLCTALTVSMGSLGVAGEQRQAQIKEYTGQVKSVKIDKCGLQPGSCEGSIVLAQAGSGEVSLAIRPGTWIQRGNQLVLIDELGVGNYIKARAVQMPGVRDELAITLEDTKRQGD